LLGLAVEAQGLPESLVKQESLEAERALGAGQVRVLDPAMAVARAAWAKEWVKAEAQLVK